MNHTKLLLSILLALSLSSCRVVKPMPSNENGLIQVGMDKQEVIRELGNPESKTIENGIETLEFSTNLVNGSDEYTLLKVRLKGNKVIATEPIPKRKELRELK
ncbi:MAG: hypothetical protein J6I79_06980 [Paludibacteraceae bacterium]|nr:hypothetical protein [Paludibacteraceae bacterium]